MPVQSLGQEDPPEKELQRTPVFLPGESHGQRSLVGYIPQGREESDTTEHPRNIRTLLLIFGSTSPCSQQYESLSGKS